MFVEKITHAYEINRVILKLLVNDPIKYMNKYSDIWKEYQCIFQEFSDSNDFTFIRLNKLYSLIKNGKNLSDKDKVITIYRDALSLERAVRERMYADIRYNIAEFEVNCINPSLDSNDVDYCEHDIGSGKFLYPNREHKYYIMMENGMKEVSSFEYYQYTDDFTDDLFVPY